MLIACRLLRLDTILNVDQKRDAAAILFWGLRAVVPCSGDPLFDCILRIVRAEGFQAGKPLLFRGTAGDILAAFDLVARCLQTG